MNSKGDFWYIKKAFQCLFLMFGFSLALVGSFTSSLPNRVAILIGIVSIVCLIVSFLLFVYVIESCARRGRK